MFNFNKNRFLYLMDAADRFIELGLEDGMDLVVLEHGVDFEPTRGGEDDVGDVAVEGGVEQKIVMGLEFEHGDGGGDVVFDEGGGEHVEGFVVGDRNWRVLGLHCWKRRRVVN